MSLAKTCIRANVVLMASSPEISECKAYETWSQNLRIWYIIFYFQFALKLVAIWLGIYVIPWNHSTLFPRTSTNKILPLGWSHQYKSCWDYWDPLPFHEILKNVCIYSPWKMKLWFHKVIYAKYNGILHCVKDPSSHI